MTFPAAEQVIEQVKKLVQEFGSDVKTSTDLCV